MTSKSINDCDAMRITFENFMMSKVGNSNTTSHDEECNVNKIAQAREDLNRRNARLEINMKRAEKRYWHMFRCFFDMVRNEWLYIDDQLEEVVKSMTGIRNRLPMESCLLNRINDEKKRKEQAYSGNKEFLMQAQLKIGNSDDFFLKGEDVQSAISYDLLQHERMMECLRNLFANLSDCHESLSRNLDGIMQHHLKVSVELLSNSAKSHLSYGFEKVIGLMNSLNDVFRDLSMELYRKQVLVSLVFESVTDDLFLRDSLADNSNTNIIDFDLENPGPRKITFEISRRWSRLSKWSRMNVPELNRLSELVASKKKEK